MVASLLRLDPEMTLEIKTQIRRAATARHVPDEVIQVSDVPRSLNGKPSEIAVREVAHGREVKNLLGLQNPEALELFRNLPQLRIF
jgi:acetoacetyl-CoA synthetase